MHEVSWATSPNDRNNLLIKTPKDLRYLYCDENYWGEYVLKWESLRVIRKKYRKKLFRGEIMMPERSEPFENLDHEREQIKERRRRIAPKTGQAALSELISLEDRKRLHDQLDKLIDEANLPPETISQIRIKKISKWEQGIKNSDGEFEAHPLFGIQLEADPKKFEPEWLPVQRVESVRLPKREAKTRPDKSKTAVILPDLQVPYHDEQAVSVALQIIKDIKPDKIVLLGDALDLSAWGRYVQRPEYATATQDAIITLHKLLATLRTMNRTAEIVVMAGNHEKRMENMLLQNAQAAYGLKRADQLTNWPVMSVPFLAAFDTLDVEYVDGYPASRYWINERLQVRHGNIARPAGKTVLAVNNDERVSTIFGHIHRIENAWGTKNVYDGGRMNAAWAIGCLCRIDGHVPSTKSAVDQRTMQPIQNYENWQQGFAVVDYEDGDASFNVQQVFINTFTDYETRFRGKVYTP